MREYKVKASYDDDAKVWYVSDSELPGLCSEADTLDELIARVQLVAPDLVKCNSDLDESKGKLLLNYEASCTHMVA